MGTLSKKDLTARLRNKDNIDNSIPTIKNDVIEKPITELENMVVLNSPKKEKKIEKTTNKNNKETYRTCFWVSNDIKTSLDLFAINNNISIKDIVSEVVEKIKKKDVSALSKKDMLFPEQKQINAFLSKEDKSYLKILGINTGMSFKEIMIRGLVKYIESNQ